MRLDTTGLDWSHDPHPPWLGLSKVTAFEQGVPEVSAPHIRRRALTSGMSCSSSRKHALPSRTPHSLGILPSVKNDQNFLFFILKNYFEKEKGKKVDIKLWSVTCSPNTLKNISDMFFATWNWPMQSAAAVYWKLHHATGLLTGTWWTSATRFFIQVSRV